MTTVTLGVALGRYGFTPRTRTDISGACRRAADGLGADGLGVAMAVPGALRVQLGASDRSAWLLEQAELTAGEGPGTDAHLTGELVRTRDLTAPEETRWPTLSRHLRWSRTTVDAHAVIALPINDGVHTFGSVSVHSADPAGLDGLDGLDPAVLSEACTGAAATALRAHPGEPDPATEDWRLVCRAVREVATARGLDASRATRDLRTVAVADRSSLIEVARDIVAGRRPADLRPAPRPTARP